MSFAKIVEFATTYDIYALTTAFALVWIFGFVNWGKNLYRKQNKLLDACRASVLRNPKFVGVYIANIPEEYRRQWRAYVNSSAERPSLVFEFVPRKNRIKLEPVFVVCALISFAYLALFVLNPTHREYVVFQFAFWLAFAVVMMVDSICFAYNEKRAKQVFGRFVAQLNAVKPEGKALDNKTTAQKLNQLNSRDGVGSGAVEQASKILRENGLEDDRTVEEQKDINAALNGLLQAYSGSASKCKV